MRADIRVFEDLEALSRAAAHHWAELAKRAVAARGAFHVALAGGGTPRRLYQHLAACKLSLEVPWRDVHVYFGDERAVPPDHPDSNYRMAREALLDVVPLPVGQIHPIETGAGDLQAAAARYAALLRARLPPGAGQWPQFDLILLGVGEDGHTASLFPGTPILEERTEPVAAVYVEKLAAWRVSLTLPVLNAAREVLVLAAGAGKAEILRRVLAAPAPEPPYPIQQVRAGGMRWFLDRAAARALPSDLL